MARLHHRGGGRYAPIRPTPGMRAAMAARALVEERIRQQLRERMEEARARELVERLGHRTCDTEEVS